MAFNPFVLLCVFSFLLFIMIFSLWLYLRFKSPYCGGTVNPNMRYCKNGKLINGQIPESECNPIAVIQLDYYIATFLNYLLHIENITPNTTFIQLQNSFPSYKIHKGLFYFAIPELLKILPTDFGQNNYTPYGILSFFNLYSSCVSNPGSFCKSIFSKSDIKNSAGESLCQLYFNTRKKECVFPIQDTNPSLYIEDNDFFNEIGLLGAVSLYPQQVIVLHCHFPVKLLELNYWSFNLYIADDLNPNLVCQPFRQTLVASIAPSFHIYSAASQDPQKRNPVLLDEIEGYIVIGLDIEEMNKISNYIETNFSYQFLQVVPLPVGQQSIKLDPKIPNPNHLIADQPAFQHHFQRFSLFMRISPRPGFESSASLQDYIYFKNMRFRPFEVILLDPNVQASNSFVSHYTLPPIIKPYYNETELLEHDFQAKLKSMFVRLPFKGFWKENLPTRNSTLNLFAPAFRKILNTNLPYEGGFQAVQLAGNGQGDNHDTQYRASKGFCFNDEDVLIAFCVNHTYFNNCINNSINLIDINKAFGFASVQLDRSSQHPYYIVLFGRNMQLINELDVVLGSDVIKIKKFVRTGSTIDNAFPECHQGLMIERVYLNTTYASLESMDRTYRLEDLFGHDLMQQPNGSEEDRWSSLINVTAPDNSTLIKPAFFKIKKVNPSIFILVFSLIVLAIAIVFFGLSFKKW